MDVRSIILLTKSRSFCSITKFGKDRRKEGIRKKEGEKNKEGQERDEKRKGE